MTEKKDTKISEEIQKEVTASANKFVSQEMKSGKATEKKVSKEMEREYIIPIRAKLVKVQKYKRAGRAIKIVKEFLARHMKVYDRDLKKIKIDKYLNEFIWTRGIKNPPTKVRVKVFKEGGIVTVELAEMSKELKFKKARLEKRGQKATEVAMKKKTPKTEMKPEESQTEEDKNEIQEKKAAVVESGKEQTKMEAVKSKHVAKDNFKQPKHPHRKALQK